MTDTTCPGCGATTTPTRGHRTFCFDCTLDDLGQTWEQVHDRSSAAARKAAQRTFQGEGEMSLYATGINQPARPGCCTFIHHWEDVDLHCPEKAIPGGQECATHLIARVNAAPPVYRRWFNEETA
jgi:hypothetical protein